MAKLKEWQVFLYLIAASILSNFTIEGKHFETTILNVTGTLMYFSWHLLIGHQLYQLLPARIRLKYPLFVINYCLWMLLYGIYAITANGKEISLTGLPALAGLYMVYAIIQVMFFPAIVLNTLERRHRATLGDSIGDFFLIVFLPVGIWFLQPRINKVYRENENSLGE